jgi:hypothetical protein
MTSAFIFTLLPSGRLCGLLRDANTQSSTVMPIRKHGENHEHSFEAEE